MIFSFIIFIGFGNKWRNRGHRGNRDTRNKGRFGFGRIKWFQRPDRGNRNGFKRCDRRIRADWTHRSDWFRKWRWWRWI